MPKGNKTFKHRLTDALAIARKNLRCEATKSLCLFTPVPGVSGFQWAKLMDSDGLMIATRTVKGKGIKDAKIRVGVVIQCEEATAQTKANPIGKAAISQIATGVWVDLDGAQRVRLDRLTVLFVVPSPSNPSAKKRSTTAVANTELAATVMPGATQLTIPQGLQSKDIAVHLQNETRGFLVGRGRPKSLD